MTKRFSDITQSEYNQMADNYFAKIGRWTPEAEILSFKFFASIQRRLERVLQAKFKTKGLKLVKKTLDPKERKTMLYRVVSLKDAFGFSVIPQTLNFSHLMEDIRFINPQRSRDVPDIKIVDPEYLEEKIQDVAEQAFQKFLTLSNKTTESKQYDQTRNASQGNSGRSGNNQDQAALLP